MPDEHHIWTTPWDLLRDLHDKPLALKPDILQRLAGQYWHPISWYIRCKGYSVDQCEDLTQEFFFEILRGDLFCRADQRQGKFRSYIQGALENFLKKHHRAANACKRKPSGTLIRIDREETDQLMDCDQFNSPEKAFHHAWVAGLLERALEDCRRHFRFSTDPKKQKYWDVFNDRVLQPILDGKPAPSLPEVSARYDLSVDILSNIIVTVKRYMRHALRNVVGRYSPSGKGADLELEDLIRMLI